MDDPKEVEAIEEESPYPVLKRNPNSWRGICGVDWRADIAQPWFQVNIPLQYLFQMGFFDMKGLYCAR